MRERMGRFELYSFFDQKGIERRLSRMADVLCDLLSGGVGV